MCVAHGALLITGNVIKIHLIDRLNSRNPDDHVMQLSCHMQQRLRSAEGTYLEESPLGESPLQGMRIRRVFGVET